VATSSNTKLSIPTFIPLTEAVHKYALTEDVLTRLIQDGRIDAAQLPSGELLVSDESLNQKTKEQIVEERFAHLRGKPITVSDAEGVYKLKNMTIRRWIANGYIRVVNDGYPIKVDESDVAYCAKVYDEQDGKSGRRIFDGDGNPYQLKHPKLAEYRRRRRE
jgi:hypothetical protein